MQNTDTNNINNNNADNMQDNINNNIIDESINNISDNSNIIKNKRVIKKKSIKHNNKKNNLINNIEKRSKGRPTLYKKEYNEQVYKLCLLCATDNEIANFFNVDSATINRWKTDYPDFRESIKDGKIQADANVAKSLYRKAVGYEIEEEEAKVIAIGNNQGSQVKIVKVKKYYPPDTAAMNIWLKNRRGKIKDKDETGKETGGMKWADRQEIDHTTDGKEINFKVTEEQKEIMAREYLTKINQQKENN